MITKQGFIKKTLPNGNIAHRVIHKEPLTPENCKTQQQFKDECDVNRIVKNAQRGIPPRFTQRGQPQYGDFSQVPDLMGAYDIIERAQSAFMNLPAQLRLELDNDPANIASLTKDQIERYKLGKEQTLTPSPAEPVPAPETSQEAPNTGAKKSDKSDS